MSGESQLGFVNIWNGIFQGNSLSSFLFINVYVYITATGIAENEMNHLFLMDGLKLNGTNEKRLIALLILYCQECQRVLARSLMQRNRKRVSRVSRRFEPSVLNTSALYG